jgi:hypothetical protein
MFLADAAPDLLKFQKGVRSEGYDVSKSVRMLGTSYRSMEETSRDLVVDWDADKVENNACGCISQDDQGTMRRQIYFYCYFVYPARFVPVS